MDGQAEYTNTHERTILSTYPKSLWSSWAHHLISKILFVKDFFLKFGVCRFISYYCCLKSNVIHGFFPADSKQLTCLVRINGF